VGTLSALLDGLFPQRCLGCGAQGALLCAGCRAGLPRLDGPLCARCGAPTAWPVERCRECAGRRVPFADARAAVGYDGTVRALVSGWKERGLRRVAGLAADLVVEVVPRPDVVTLTWIPAHRDRTLERGHATAERLARELATRWELEPAALLERTRAVGPQRGLPLAERRRNVAGVFRAGGCVPRRVCLVDDVYTTGATVSVAATELRRAGARDIRVVTFARALRALHSGV
jgi:predicted amidophosphoribosyltransferase